MRDKLRKNIEVCLVVGFVAVWGILLSACSTPAQPVDPESGPWALHTTWVYEATRYGGHNSTNIMTTTRTITETVVERREDAPYLAVKIHRDESAETLASPDTNALRLATIGRSYAYWLVISETHLYRLPGGLNLAEVETIGELELVFPLEIGNAWYLNQAMADLYPDRQADAMLRKVQAEQAVTVPAGHFDACFLLSEVIGGTMFNAWYCPDVGWVERWSDHSGTPQGERDVLVDHHIGK